ncbi:MAG: hypothetical protein QOI11_3985 [Candidatus Eremiobacteraeota bacterium]|jgi:hypothetical protein|nr:hypothetical protein [Candidatus Eremiobacteraeota bacterium]
MRCGSRRALLLAGVLALALGPSPARADTVLPATVKEDFASAVKVSGGVLVGLELGSTKGVADPRAVRIPLGLFAKPTPVCVSAKTRDGQYWSEATLTAPGGSGDVGVLEPHTPWRFLPQLAAYARSDYAVLARYGPDCDIDPAAPYLPVVYGASPTQLTVALNVQRAVGWRTRLVFGDKPSLTGQCDEAAPNVRATAFNLVCRFDLGTLARDAGTAQLVLNRRERTGDRTDTFDIRFAP